MRISACFRAQRFAAVLVLLTSLGMAQSNLEPPTAVITHVTVINPGTSSIRKDQTIVIAGGHIVAVTDAAKYQPAKNMRVIDGTGQYLIPGLWDMHVHAAFGDWFPGGCNIILPLFIANGVTGVRDMGGDVPVLKQWREEIATNQIV